LLDMISVLPTALGGIGIMRHSTGVKRHSLKLGWCIAAMTSALLISVIGIKPVWSAEMQGQDYFTLLGIAAKAVRAQKNAVPASSEGGPISAVAALGLERRPLQVGEKWRVSFTPSNDSIARMSMDPVDLQESKRNPLFFEFRVTNISQTTSGRLAQVEVKQDDTQVRKGYLADPRVDSILITLNERFGLVRKEIRYRDGRAPGQFQESPQENVVSGFSAYPIDLPNVSTVSGETLRDIPAALKGRIKVDLAHTLDFQFSDLYARPMRAIWQDSDPWPVYVESPAGIAVLISKSVSPKGGRL